MRPRRRITFTRSTCREFTSSTKVIATISEVERILTSMMTSDRETVKIALAGTSLVEQKGGSNTKEAFRDCMRIFLLLN
ncbi:hypothetical protein DMP08_02720 [Paraeggerthella hongkongensis]|uniref:Uncharacterized protein n=1 Tax=Paraeggerthella hongkongensis TaxID=230658 RepID=A0A3N0BIP7_9ACTN|nr:hypothetical protein DMP08_02720 [Paraeggerthella hongkongensis]